MCEWCCAAPPSMGSLRSIRLPLPHGPRWAGKTLLLSPLQAFVQIMEKKTEGESWLKKPQPTHFADLHNWTFTRKLAPVKIRVRSRNSIRARRGGAAGGLGCTGKFSFAAGAAWIWGYERLWGSKRSQAGLEGGTRHPWGPAATPHGFPAGWPHGDTSLQTGKPVPVPHRDTLVECFGYSTSEGMLCSFPSMH